MNESQNGSFYYTLNNLTAGNYNLTITDGSNTITIGFSVVTERIFFDAKLVETTEIVNVNTSNTVTTPDYNDGSFGELLNLSQSGTIYYGTTDEINQSKTYHFVLVDQNYNGVYDTVYVDDDKIFELYNYSEDYGNSSDIEDILVMGNMYKNYIIGFIDFSGKGLFLARPPSSLKYSLGDTVSFIVLARYENMIPAENQSVSVKLIDPNGVIVNSTSGVTNEWGYFVSDFQIPSTTGVYKIDVNNGMGMELFYVESFKLTASITDLSDTPMTVFAPNPRVKITLVSKNLNDTPINLSSVYARIIYPNGTVSTVNFSQESTGMYSTILNLIGAPTGFYGVRITGTYSNNRQELVTGFSIESVSFSIQAVNIHFIEEADSPEAMVNAFAPGSNISIVTFLSNFQQEV